MTTNQEPRCKRLVLDAGPLLSLSPLRGIAQTYLTVPQVLAELKDDRAREHFERLGLLSGVKVEVRSPDAASLAHVVQWAKKTGDYSKIKRKRRKKMIPHKRQVPMATKEGSTSVTDNATTEEQNATITVEDLTEQLDQTTLEEDDASNYIEPENTGEDDSVHEEHSEAVEEEGLEPLDVELTPIQTEEPARPPQAEALTLQKDHEDDGEGEWITPSNVALHKSRALDLLPEDGLKSKGKKAKVIGSGCMTADFAMQNVLLQMGLNLVDNSKKFCPSCGNPTLLRASVTVSAPGAAANAPVMKVHLKPNFQYKTRGTIYSIPAPKAGSAKTGPGTGLILREDQIEYMRAKKRADGKRIMGRGVDGRGGVSSWMDPDWVPEIISVGSGGRGRTSRSSNMDGDMPQIGYGRKNPNEKRRKK
ncbi:hypothetical protein BDZ97DRAFT_1902544 [Flammula alnicola]|nr:hypothetical protein BDZ97DRAFT_1902544 [Flammula alnicola]